MSKVPNAKALVAVLALALIVIASACGSSGTPHEAASTAFSADVGCDPRVSAAMDEWVERGVAASIVDLGGKRQCVAGFGLADQETGRTNDVDTVFSIGSITKPFTAAAIFDLIDAGVLTLDDTAGQHVPGLGGLAGESTVRNLLLHITGLSGEHGFDHVAMTKVEAIASISNLEQASEPSAVYLYNNTNYSVLALIIDEVTEQGYRQYVVDEILLDRNRDPLDAGWWDGTPSPTGPRAWGYVGAAPAEQRGQAAGPHWAMDGNGAMAMSPLTMAEWTWAFFNERILSPQATRSFLATSTRLAGAELELSGWAKESATVLGFEFFATSGGGSGIGHEMTVAYIPESGRVLVLVANAVDHDVRSFMEDVIVAFVVGTGIPTPPPIPESAVDVATMTGSYGVGNTATMSIEANDGGLVVSLKGLEALAAIYPMPETESDEVARQLEAAQAKLHDALAGDLVGDEMRRMNRLIGNYGPLEDAAIDGVFFEGRVTVVATVTFRDQGLPASFHTDILDVDDFSINNEPTPDDLTLFFVYDEDANNGAGGFVERWTPPGLEKTALLPTDGGVEIVGISGTSLAYRQD